MANERGAQQLPLLDIPIDAVWHYKGVVVAGGRENNNTTYALYGPHNIFVDDEKTVIVVDYGNHRIKQWRAGDTKGQVVAGGKGSGKQLDQLNYPTDVLVDKATNSLVICDRDNRRVVRWARGGDTTEGEILIKDILCWGLAMDNDGYLYVSDTVDDVVRRYRIGDQQGIVVAGGNSSGLKQPYRPRYIFVDEQQTVYMSETPNERVIKWNKGATSGIIVAGGHGRGESTDHLRDPKGIFVDKRGTVYVADFLNSRVMRWPKGATSGTTILNAIQVTQPTGLFFDQQGNLYVSDQRYSNVLRFSLA